MSTPSNLRRTDLMRQLAGRYDALATDWDTTIGRLGFDDTYRKLHARAARMGYLQNLRAGSRVLDVGVGTGSLSAALVQQTRLPLTVDGIDISAEMLAVADRNLRAVGAQPNLRVQDVKALDKPNHYDMVMAAHVLEHLPDPVAALCRMVRALKPGAPLLLSVTRQGLWGHYIRKQWGIHPASIIDLHLWCAQAQLVDVERLQLHPLSWRKAASLVIIGRKVA